MKKVWILLGLVSFLGGISSVCAEEEVPIVDVSILQGVWDGSHTKINTYPISSSLEIFNDAVPLKGVLTSYARGTNRYPFENGVVENGKLFIQWEKDKWIKLGMYKNGKTVQLRGEFYWHESSGWGYDGTSQFQKKNSK